MPKGLTIEEIHVAPNIIGKIDNNGNPYIKDELSDEIIEYSIDGKIFIYERQVNGWFLNRAQDLLEKDLKNGTEENCFIILMICLSYLEGNEQYREGKASHNNSSKFFVNSIKRLYQCLSKKKLAELYTDARCGLFHNGMINKKTILSYHYKEPINFNEDSRIRINPKLLLSSIKQDFEEYIQKLKDIKNKLLRDNFDKMFNLL